VIAPGLFWPHQAIVYARNEPLSISMLDKAAAFTLYEQLRRIA